MSGLGVRLPFRLKLRLFVRSLALQASWNNERMQNLGLLATMLPWARRRGRDIHQNRLFCRRYYEFFNTNPYLANFLVGGLVRLEAERDAGHQNAPGLTATFRDSLGRALASLGDQLFWLGIRPALVMAICLLGLWGQMAALLAVVSVFAVAQLALRWLSLERGYQLGFDLVELLQHRHWHRGIAFAERTGMVLTGLTGGVFLAQVMEPGAGVPQVLLWVGIGAGLGLPSLLRRRLPGELLILVALGLAILLIFAKSVGGG